MTTSQAKKSFWGYIAISVIYSLQGTLYPSGIINQMCQMMMILWAALVGWTYLSPFGNKTENSNFITVCRLLLLMYIIYGFIGVFQPPKHIDGLDTQTSPYRYLQNSLNSLLPIFMFAFYAKKGILTRRTLQIIFYLFLILSILSMLRSQAEALLIKGQEAGTVQNNSGYLFVTLMPLVLALRNKILQFGLMLILLAIIVYCIKRGAILCGLICFVYFAYETYKKSKSIKMRLGIAILVIGSFTAETAYLVKEYNENKYFQARVEATLEGNDSGRGELKEWIWRSIERDTTLTSLLFGHGADATIDAAGNFAHQDWLETFYDTGITGSVILGLFYLIMFKSIYGLRDKISSEYYIMLMMLFISCFLPTFFSMSIQSMGTIKTMLIGLLLYISQPKRIKASPIIAVS